MYYVIKKTLKIKLNMTKNKNEIGSDKIHLFIKIYALNSMS